MNADNLIRSVLPADQFTFMEALGYLKRRNLIQAKIMAEQMANANNDPGAQLLYALCLYWQQDQDNGYPAVEKAEAMAPRNAFRCWALLQCALRAGDKAVVLREGGHLAGDAEYGKRAKDIVARVQAMR
jgi:hypothetical protein